MDSITKKYIIKRLGVHDGYYKADPSLAKKMQNMEVIPFVENGKTLMKLREEPETRVERKGQPAVTLFEAGTYVGDFAIPALHVERTHLSEAYLKVVDAITGEVELEDKKATAVDIIEKKIEELTEMLADLKAAPIAKAAVADVAKLVSSDSKGTLVVEDDSKLPKTAVKPGFYIVDDEGNPDPDKPGEEPAFSPIAEEDKQAKFIKAEALVEEKRLAALKDKKGKGK